ncbi:hypothetical protein D3C81_1174210 [compost metagenome]
MVRGNRQIDDLLADRYVGEGGLLQRQGEQAKIGTAAGRELLQVQGCVFPQGDLNVWIIFLKRWKHVGQQVGAGNRHTADHDATGP